MAVSNIAATQANGVSLPYPRLCMAQHLWNRDAAGSVTMLRTCCQCLKTPESCNNLKNDLHAAAGQLERIGRHDSYERPIMAIFPPNLMYDNHIYECLGHIFDAVHCECDAALHQEIFLCAGTFVSATETTCRTQRILVSSSRQIAWNELTIQLSFRSRSGVFLS